VGIKADPAGKGGGRKIPRAGSETDETGATFPPEERLPPIQASPERGECVIWWDGAGWIWGKGMPGGRKARRGAFL